MTNAAKDLARAVIAYDDANCHLAVSRVSEMPPQVANKQIEVVRLYEAMMTAANEVMHGDCDD